MRTDDQIEPYTRQWVLRFSEHSPCGGTGYTDHRTELTERRCFEIAQMNGYMTTDEVHRALLRGQRVYSFFSYFVLE